VRMDVSVVGPGDTAVTTGLGLTAKTRRFVNLSSS
jgi:hypothetical protein